uniref:26S proteasome non-ATPase regulatory subunit 4 homolog isoform X2 n=1 Tax=Erigeron canadensis TaxID=72917 RepID=UPI001CB97E96|nr:26S proteasome non-ATPase regulatory subunit 4 homolog isoform X2 [Erigeron canadensis]
MMAEPIPEFTVICIDNGRRAVYCEEVYHAQVKAARLYCKTVLKCDPKNIVSIITMSSLGFGVLVHPTSDLEQIMSALRYVPCQGEGETEVQWALASACATFSSAPSDMNKRLLMFIGSTISLHLSEASSYGKKLKESGVAVNIFNFFRLKIDSPYFNPKSSVLEGNYHYGRAELDLLLATVNDDGYSHIVDIVYDYESSVIDHLRKSILKDHDHYLKKKAAIDNEKNKSAADEKNKSGKAQEFNEKNIGAANDGYGKRFSRKKESKRGQKN